MNKGNYKASDIACWFIKEFHKHGDCITHLKLQKMVYYAQAWALVFFDKPLFNEHIEAWTHGPVIPKLFNEYKEYGLDYEPLPEPKSCPESDENTKKLIEDIIEVYGEHSARYLEELTHQEDPWRNARKNLPLEAKSNEIITQASMLDFYTKLRKKATNG